MPANLPVGWWVSEPPLDPALPPRHAKLMHTTRFFLIRHALVTPAARSILYGSMDVALCQMTLRQEAALYRWLAARLPPGSHWVTSQLARTKATAAAIFAGGYPAQPLEEEPDLAEQHLGEWQGIVHEALVERLRHPRIPSGPMPPRRSRRAARVLPMSWPGWARCWSAWPRRRLAAMW